MVFFNLITKKINTTNTNSGAYALGIWQNNKKFIK